MSEFAHVRSVLLRARKTGRPVQFSVIGTRELTRPSRAVPFEVWFEGVFERAWGEGLEEQLTFRLGRRLTEYRADVSCKRPPYLLGPAENPEECLQLGVRDIAQIRLAGSDRARRRRRH